MENLKYDDLVVFTNCGWGMYIHDDQRYLGRSYIWRQDRSEVDLADMSRQEWVGFRRALTIATTILRKAFQPNLFNYASLRNLTRVQHLHIIPRYESPRFFCEETFIDDRWNKNYAPYEEHKPQDQFLISLRDHLKAFAGDAEKEWWESK